MASVKIAFQERVRSVSFDRILPSKMLSAAVTESAKYKRIAASISEVGLVEPLILAEARAGDVFTLLDGHVRLAVLKEQGAVEARCILAKDDEAFTYNKRVNRLQPIQEHYMIVRAIERGVLIPIYVVLGRRVWVVPRVFAPIHLHHVGSRVFPALDLGHHVAPRDIFA